MTYQSSKGLSEASLQRLAATYYKEDDPYAKEDVSKQDDWMRMKDKSETNLENWKETADPSKSLKNYPHKDSPNKLSNHFSRMTNSGLIHKASKSLPNTSLKSKQSQELNEQEDMLNDPSSLDDRFVISDFSEDGKGGFSEAKELILEMTRQGFEDIDILVQIHETFPKDVAEMVLVEARRKGLI